MCYIQSFLFVMKTMALVSYILIYITGVIWINQRVINSYKYTSLYRSSFVCTKVNIIPFLVSCDVNHTSSTNVNGRIRGVIMCYLHRRCYSHTYGGYCEHSAIVIVAHNATLNAD